MRKSMKGKKISATILVTAMLIILWNPTAVYAAVTNGYLVYKSADLATPQATVSTLSDAFSYVNSNASSDEWTIKVTADDPAVGAAATLSAPGATVTLTADSQHTISQTAAGVRHIQAAAGTLNLENIILDGASTGGGIVIGSGVNAFLNANAVVQNCRAGQGGGIYNSGSLTLNSGSKISGCQSTFSGTGGSGAGIYSTGPVTLNDGCLVAGNTANGGKGGGLAMCLSNAVLTMNGGEISGNTVTSYSTDFMGGGVVVYGGAIFNMHGGKINGNTADIGAGVAVSDGAQGSGSCFTMYDGEIFGNTAVYSGAGSHGMGGGIFAWSWTTSTFTMEGGEIHDNTAHFGGGIGTNESTTITLNHGTIDKNVSDYAGGIYLTGPASVNNEFRITNNVSRYYGGGIYVRGGNLIINDSVEISGNTAGIQGGGLFLYAASTGIMNSGAVTGNQAGKGGGIALWGTTGNLCSFTMYAAGAPKLYGNTADDSGDDVYGNGTAMSITLIKVPEMVLPADIVAENWFIDTAGVRYRDPSAAKTVFVDTSLNAITNAVQLTIGALYQIQYNANGGTGTKTDLVTPTISYTVLTVENTGISRNGYTFKAWNTSADGSGSSYNPENIISITGNITLFAQWTPVPYTVSFDSQGGSSVGSQTAYYGTTATEPTDPARTGNTFSGWYKDAACTVSWNFSKDTVIGDTVLYAKWTPIVYVVTFDSQGGSSVTSQDVNSGMTVTKPSDPMKTGNTFSGWYKDAACTVPWDFAEDTVTDNLTLYAKWRPIIYVVTFDSQGGTSVNSQDVNSGMTSTKPSDPTKTDNTFSGWYKDAACTVAWDFAQDKVTGNLTLYAKWTERAKAMPAVTASTKTGESENAAILLCGIAALSISLGLGVVVFRRRKDKKRNDNSKGNSEDAKTLR